MTIPKTAVDAARAILTWDAVYLDTETTGLGPADQVVEVALVSSAGEILYHTLVKPTVPISEDASAVHGISEAAVKDAPSIDQVLPVLIEKIGGRHLVIYNADFDIRLLSQSAAAAGLTFEPKAQTTTCAMKLYAYHRGEWNSRFGNYRWHSLRDAARHEQIVLPEGMRLHSAAADAETTRLLLRRMAGLDKPEGVDK